MIVTALATLIAVAPSAKAHTDFTLTWTSGEASRDASRSATTWTLAGTALTVTNEYSGRNSGMPGFGSTGPRSATLDETQLKLVAERLAAIESLPKKGFPKAKSREGVYTDIRFASGARKLDLHFFERLEFGQPPTTATPAEREAVTRLEALRGLMFEILP